MDNKKKSLFCFFYTALKKYCNLPKLWHKLNYIKSLDWIDVVCLDVNLSDMFDEMPQVAQTENCKQELILLEDETQVNILGNIR